MHPQYTTATIARFWSKVDRSGDCWVWTAGKNGRGYGKFNVGYTRFYAHRFAFLLTFGAIPDGMVVCHRCDTPSCVRPDHLFAGTQQENLRDMAAKGRHPSHAHPHLVRGEQNGFSKLSDDQVREIRARVAAGESRRLLSIEFNTTQTNISNIVLHINWKHID